MVPRLALYGAASTTLAAAVIGSALKTRANFFAAAVTVGRSSGSLMVLANYALFNVICFGILVKKVFFGQLRQIEYEHLFERLWIFLTESLLALTIFSREKDFSFSFIMLYSLLLFLKCFHWITADRVDYMDQIPAPGPARLFHVRITTIISILFTLDLMLVIYTLDTIAFYGVSSTVLFASEFMILLASIMGVTARYGVGLWDLHRARGREDAPVWEEKSMYLFYIDLAVDFAKLLTYLCFFTVILLNYGLPLHILRDVYMTLRSFLSRCSDLIRYRKATRDMDALYPNATAEEVQSTGDHTCIICREEMVVNTDPSTSSRDGPNETPKKLSCGHIFHFHCLRSWLERQQSCPTCRRDVLGAPQPGRRQAPAVPPPAPGQIPPPDQAPLAAGVQNAAREPLPTPLQAMYNEFFHPNPQNRPGNGPAPFAPHTQAPTPPQPQTNEERLQTGIWGGPVVPGRFFPSPLGAGTSRDPRSTSRGPAVSSTSTNATAAGPSSVPAAQEPLREPRLQTAFTDLTDFVDIASRGRGPAQSGSVTPFSSNPPEIFRSPGTHRASISTVVPSDKEGEVEDDDESQEPLDTAGQRRIAAEAAMRRLGITSVSGGTVSSAGTPQPDALAMEVPETDVKGKGKAVEKMESAQRESMTDIPRFIPYLSSSLPPPHPQTVSRSWTSKTRDLGELRRDLESKLSGSDAAGGLEDRIRVLREVDEVIWNLMGELTQVQSRWEAEDHRIRDNAGTWGD